MTKMNPSGMLRIDLPDLEATRHLGKRLASLLQPGDVIALIGPLGAGKTHLTGAVAEGLGLLPGQQVSSPTFVLMHLYQARLPIYHFDAYRLHGEAEFDDLGVEDYLEGDGVCLIEWADKIPGCLPIDHLRLELSLSGEFSRCAALQGAGPRSRALIEALRTPDNLH